jgi:hypothetical protein
MPAPLRDYTDLWYGGEAQSGWGLNVTPDVREVGTAEITFFDALNAMLTFTVNGTVVTKPMARQPF